MSDAQAMSSGPQETRSFIHFGPEGKGTARPRAVDKAEVMQVIVTESLRGRGSDGDPCRIVTQFWSLDGKPLAEVDPEHVHRLDGMWKEGD